jgi:hypothetical protein
MDSRTRINGYQTPRKVSALVADEHRESDVKTVSTAATESPFLSPSVSGTPAPSPSFKRRANLMTLVFDMKNVNKGVPPKPVARKLDLNESPLSEKSTNKNDDDEGVLLDKSLQLIVKSTDRIFNDAHRDLDKELQRKYPEPTSTYSDDEEEQVCRELTKLQRSEKSCQHEVNFAIDKIAYRHSSTTEWASNCDLIQKSTRQEDAGAVKTCNNNDIEDEDFFDRFCEIFCCNHGIDMKNNQD